jgi:hypothetical protein
MKFFMPLKRDAGWEREAYDRIKLSLSTALETEFTERKICSLHYQQDGREYDVDVGQPHPLTNETVVAILYGTSPARYYVCTHTRGIVHSSPMFIGARDVFSVTEFEPG